MNHSLLPPSSTRARPLDVVVACPLCGSAEGDELYAREVETHSVLGRVDLRLELCTDCGLLFVNPRPTKAELRRHYESRSASGNTWHATGEGSRGARFLAYRTDFVRRVAERFGAGGALLDVGCASGNLLSALELPSWTLHGLEPSTAAAREARERGLDVACATLEDSPLAERSFDVVTCISCLEHAWDPCEFLNALERHMKPGGCLVLSVPDSLAPVAQVSEFYGFEHLTHFTRATLTRLLASRGLVPILFEQAEGPSLNVAAVRAEAGQAVAPVVAEDRAEDRGELVRAVARYVAERREFEEAIAGRLRALADEWEGSDARIAIYGAGVHTRFLLDLVDLSPRVSCLLDSDPAKAGREYLGWRVYRPEDLSGLNVEAVIVSSKPFHREMVARIRPIAERAGVQVIELYPEAA